MTPHQTLISLLNLNRGSRPYFTKEKRHGMIQLAVALGIISQSEWEILSVFIRENIFPITPDRGRQEPK